MCCKCSNGMGCAVAIEAVAAMDRFNIFNKINILGIGTALAIQRFVIVTNWSLRQMAKINLVTVSGNLGVRSRTRALIDAVADKVADRADIVRTDITVGELAPELGALIDPSAIPPKVAAAIAAIAQADLLVVGTPVYKGSYTGLFKHLFDFIDPNALAGLPVVLTATGGTPRHALVIEHQLRPLFGFFLAHTAPTGVFALDSEFTDYRLTGHETAARVEQAASEAVQLASLGRLRQPQNIAA